MWIKGFGVGLVVFVLILVVLAIWRNRVWILDLLRRRAVAGRGQATVVVPATGGWLSGTGEWIGRNWLALVMVAFFFLVVGLCCYEVVSIPRKIAQDGHEFKEALAEIARKATSPADTQQKLPKEELEEAPSPLSRVEMVDWWVEHGRPRPADGWKETGTEVDFHANGELGLVPVVNTAFWEGYELEVQPLFGTELLGSPFTSHILAGLVSSNDDNQDFGLRLGGNRVNRMPIDQQTGLIWLRTMPSSKYGVPEPVKGFGFTVRVVEPKNNSYLVKRKQGSVRFAYQREFRPAPGKEEMSRCCRLPFEIEVLSGPVQVDFDLDVTLTPLPKSGKTTVDKTRPNQRDLDERVVVLMLAADDNRAVVFPERQVNEWHVRLRSEDMRQTWSNPHQYKHGTLWFKCLIPVGVHVAAQIGGTRR